MIRKLEKKFGRLAIPGLMRYIIVLYAVGYIIGMMSPDFYTTYLMFDVDKVLSGQVWRVVTFLIQPMDDSIVFLLISLWLYFMIGNSLEQRWGSFRFTLYYASGIVFNILAVVIMYFVFLAVTGSGYSFPISLDYINLSLFLAFAVEYAEVRLLVMFVIPIKIKYIAIFYAVIEGYEIVSALLRGTPFDIGSAVASITALMNFIIFFFATRNYRRISPQEIHRRRAYRQGVQQGVQSGPASVHEGRRVITRHRCAVCGRTELDGEDLEFRFCSKCDGNFEYCMDHLYTHTHVVREQADNGTGQE